jgi:hypothetical protein
MLFEPLSKLKKNAVLAISINYGSKEFYTVHLFLWQFAIRGQINFGDVWKVR